MPNYCGKCGNVTINGHCQTCDMGKLPSYKKEFSSALTCEKCGKHGRYTQTDEKTKQPKTPILCYECAVANRNHDFFRAHFDGTYSNPVEALDSNKRADIQSKLYWGEKVGYDDDEYLQAIFVDFGSDGFEKAKSAMDKHKELVAEGYTQQQALRDVTGRLKPSEFKKICERLE